MLSIINTNVTYYVTRINTKNKVYRNYYSFLQKFMRDLSQHKTYRRCNPTLKKGKSHCLELYNNSQ
jgi:hypothetical protein